MLLKTALQSLTDQLAQGLVEARRNRGFCIRNRAMAL